MCWGQLPVGSRSAQNGGGIIGAALPALALVLGETDTTQDRLAISWRVAFSRTVRDDENGTIFSLQ
jgi:hypothetical protein